VTACLKVYFPGVFDPVRGSWSARGFGIAWGVSDPRGSAGGVARAARGLSTSSSLSA